MEYRNRQNRNANAHDLRFARPEPTSDERPTGRENVSPLLSRSATLFLVGLVVGTLFAWFNDYQTQVPCPPTKYVLPSGAEMPTEGTPKR